MFDWRWKLMQALCYGLQRVGRGRGRFVFAVAARPEPGNNRIEIAVADTTVIPSKLAVRALVDHVVDAHVDAAMHLFAGDMKLPAEIREAMQAAGIEIAQIDDKLPARTWRTDEVGQA